MVSKKKLPVGVDIFDKLIRQDFYYVDKTGFIADLLRNWGKSICLRARAGLENP